MRDESRKRFQCIHGHEFDRVTCGSGFQLACPPYREGPCVDVVVHWTNRSPWTAGRTFSRNCNLELHNLPLFPTFPSVECQVMHCGEAAVKSMLLLTRHQHFNGAIWFWNCTDSIYSCKFCVPTAQISGGRAVDTVCTRYDGAAARI